MKDIDKIATKIMGWEKRIAYFNLFPSEHWFDGNERQAMVTSWHPSTNIAHAWQVAIKAKIKKVPVFETEKESAMWICKKALKIIENK